MGTAGDLTITWENSPFATSAKQLFPLNTIGGVDVTLANIGNPEDFGMIEFEDFSEPRPLLDGEAFYGGVWSAAREIQLPILARCGSAVAAMDFIRTLDKWFTYTSPTSGILKVSRDDGAAGTIDSFAYAYQKERQSFVNPPGGGPGIMGDVDNGILLYILKLKCPFPHLISQDASTDTTQNWTTGTINRTWTNNGPHKVGCKITISSAVSLSSVTITNNTTGRYITVTDTFGADVVIDWYGSSPTELAVYRGSTDLMGNINETASMILVPGDNDIDITGSGTSFSLDVEWYEQADSV